MTTKSLFFLPALLLTFLGASVASADLISVTTTVTAVGQPAPSAQNINLASPTAGLVGPNGSVAFGDGTLEDFAFFQQPTGPDDGTGVPTAFATAGTNNITINALPAGSFNESSTGSFAQINDQAGNSFSSNIVLGSDVSGTIDTSSFDSGTVYLAFGTFEDFAQIAVTASGGTTLISDSLGSTDSGSAFSTTGTPFDFSTAFATGTSTGTAVAAFDFDNVSNGFANSLLNYQAINTDFDGSRARFYGIAIDGVVASAQVVPEPSSLAVLGFALFTAASRRRRR